QGFTRQEALVVPVQGRPRHRVLRPGTRGGQDPGVLPRPCPRPPPAPRVRDGADEARLSAGQGGAGTPNRGAATAPPQRAGTRHSAPDLVASRRVVPALRRRRSEADGGSVAPPAGP